VTENAGPAQQIGAVHLVDQAIRPQCINRLRRPRGIEQARMGAEHTLLCGQPRGDECAVGQFTDANDQVKALGHRIRQPLGEIQFKPQCRVALSQGGQYRNHIALAEGRETGQPQGSTDVATNRGNFLPGIHQFRQDALGPHQQGLACVGQRELTR